MADIETEIIERERAVLDRWVSADTLAYGQRCDPDVVYFDTYMPERIDGVDALQAHLGAIGANIRAMLQARGKPKLDRHEMLRPRVHQFGDVALLTFDWAVYIDADSQRWRATVLYRRHGDDWRMVHAHWSLVQPPAGASAG